MRICYKIGREKLKANSCLSGGDDKQTDGTPGTEWHAGNLITGLGLRQVTHLVLS